MSVTQLRGSQLKNLTIHNLQIAADAAIQLSKLEKQVITQDGTVAFSAHQSMGGFRLTNLADGVATNDAITLGQLQSYQAGLQWKQSARAATTGNITLSGLQTIDGINVTAGMRVLVKDQTLPAENGIYIVSADAWTRATDADNSPVEELVSAALWVEQGTLNADTGWTCNTDVGFVINTDPISFVQFNGAAGTTAGDGLSKDGNIINVNAGDGIQILSDNVTVKAETGKGISVGAGGVGVVLDSASSLRHSASGLQVALDPTSVVTEGVDGLKVDLERAITNSNGAIGINVAVGGVLSVAGNALSLTTGDGLVKDSGTLKVDLAPSTFLEFTAGKLDINAAIGGNGLAYAAGVLDIDLGANSGLGFTGAGSDKLSVVLGSNSFLTLGATGLTIDTTALVNTFIAANYKAGVGLSTADNTTYTMAEAPVTGTVSIFLNGQEMREGIDNDFVRTGTSVVFNAANTGADVVTATYFKAQ